MSMTTIHSNEFIVTFHGNLPESLCKSIIAKYEADDNRMEGKTLSGLNREVKRTMDLRFSNLDAWKDIDFKVHDILQKSLNSYFEMIPQEYRLDNMMRNVRDTGYQIQRYTVNDGFYSWHHDFHVESDGSFRLLTFLWYLNTVDKGGETEFYNGGDVIKIKPQQGKLIIFPATWEMRHRGTVPVSNDKYIMTGWVYVNPYQKQGEKKRRADI